MNHLWPQWLPPPPGHTPGTGATDCFTVDMRRRGITGQPETNHTLHIDLIWSDSHPSPPWCHNNSLFVMKSMFVLADLLQRQWKNIGLDGNICSEKACAPQYQCPHNRSVTLEGRARSLFLSFFYTWHRFPSTDWASHLDDLLRGSTEMYPVFLEICQLHFLLQCGCNHSKDTTHRPNLLYIKRCWNEGPLHHHRWSELPHWTA